MDTGSFYVGYIGDGAARAEDEGLLRRYDPDDEEPWATIFEGPGEPIARGECGDIFL